jgi:predicted dehydrogenase
MDYTKKNLFFRVKKVLRYLKLYGLSRTLIKVQGQYHMKKSYVNLPQQEKPVRDGGHIGLIGCGNYGYSNIAYYVNKKYKGALRGCMDININAAASLYEKFGLRYYTDDVNDILKDDQIDLVYIASNHASHAEYAISCIEAGKHVHIEKPHVVNDEQFKRLTESMNNNPKVNVYLGFNRPKSELFKQLQSYLKKEDGPLMINWFVAGHEIPDDHWYFDEKEGGRVLGNLCHWTDLTLKLVGLEKAFPCNITPTVPENSKSDFVFSVLFADRSCATITFSAKGHTFEGVKEVLNIHKGNLLGNITDFYTLNIEVVEKKIKKKLIYRDHGHKVNIYNSVSNHEGEKIEHINLTAKFFLAFKEALDKNKSVIVERDH